MVSETRGLDQLGAAVLASPTIQPPTIVGLLGADLYEGDICNMNDIVFSETRIKMGRKYPICLRVAPISLRQAPA